MWDLHSIVREAQGTGLQAPHTVEGGLPMDIGSWSWAVGLGSHAVWEAS